VLCIGGSALADTGVLLADGRSADSGSLATGQQLLLTGRSGALPFAGRQIALEGFSGIVGYANDLAYLAVLEGSAKVGAVEAGPGWILMLGPYGAPASAERFDAGRLVAQFSEPARQASPSAFANLQQIAARQGRGIWLGRLGQTRFNVAASGSARNERATRTLMGAPIVREIRFSGLSDPKAVEQTVAARFLEALKAGDAAAAAALMDPTPFGGRTLGGGADAARRQAAAAVIASRNWGQIVGSASPQFANGAWRAGGASVELRRIDDFIFVSQVTGAVR
jgi:hypothetical protein